MARHRLVTEFHGPVEWSTPEDFRQAGPPECREDEKRCSARRVKISLRIDDVYRSVTSFAKSGGKRGWRGVLIRDDSKSVFRVQASTKIDTATAKPTITIVEKPVRRGVH
jgi:hypothetical protein